MFNYCDKTTCNFKVTPYINKIKPHMYHISQAKNRKLKNQCGTQKISRCNTFSFIYSVFALKKKIRVLYSCVQMLIYGLFPFRKKIRTCPQTWKILKWMLNIERERESERERERERESESMESGQ